MTYKEFTECARPELLSEMYTGGVYGCPYKTKFKDGECILTRDCLLSDHSADCNECWNTKMDINETARAIEIYGSDWYFSALTYIRMHR